MANSKNTLGFLMAFFLATTAFGQPDSLHLKINKIIATSPGTIGVFILHLENRDTLSFRGREHFPMQSVYKFHLALAVLDQVDRGALALHQKIHIAKSDLLPNTHSPLRDQHPDGNIDLELAEILRFTVSQSDNNGCDILFRLLGGPHNVEKFIHSLGVSGVAIATTEAEMHKAWDVQFKNWSEPKSVAMLLDLFFQRKILTPSSSDFLWKLMTETTTGTNRIKGLLPAGTIVAHKTGLSDTNAQGVTAATNDVGIVTLPNGMHFAIVVFVSNATGDDTARAGVIAKISREAWDYFNK